MLRVEVLGLRVDEHLAREARVELRNGNSARGAEHLVVFVAENLGRDEDRHRVRVVERDLAGVDARQIFEHADHRRVIVAEHIELEEVILHAVIFKVRGDRFALGVVRRVLDGCGYPAEGL